MKLAWRRGAVWTENKTFVQTTRFAEPLRTLQDLAAKTHGECHLADVRTVGSRPASASWLTEVKPELALLAQCSGRVCPQFKVARHQSKDLGHERHGGVYGDAVPSMPLEGLCAMP